MSVCASVCNGFTQKRLNQLGCNLCRHNLPNGLELVLGLKKNRKTRFCYYWLDYIQSHFNSFIYEKWNYILPRPLYKSHFILIICQMKNFQISSIHIYQKAKIIVIRHYSPSSLPLPTPLLPLTTRWSPMPIWPEIKYTLLHNSHNRGKKMLG